MLRRTAFACLSLLLTASVCAAQPENWKLVRDKTEARLREIVNTTRGAMGLAVVDLTSGEKFSINETMVFPQGSAIKIPIMMEVYRQALEARFKLTDKLMVDK